MIHKFYGKIVNTPHKIQKGLMNVKKLNMREGMLCYLICQQ